MGVVVGILIGILFGVVIAGFLFAGDDWIMSSNDTNQIYKECEAALLRMYIDGVMTAEEYHQISHKLNKLWEDIKDH